MQTFSTVVTICSGLTAILTLISVIVKPIRERIFGLKELKKVQEEERKAAEEQARVLRAGIECLIRSNILTIYYQAQKCGQIRQYQRENVDLLYAAYKALGGNSFIRDVYDEIREYKVTT